MLCLLALQVTGVGTSGEIPAVGGVALPKKEGKDVLLLFILVHSLCMEWLPCDETQPLPLAATNTSIAALLIVFLFSSTLFGEHRIGGGLNRGEIRHKALLHRCCPHPCKYLYL